MTTAERKQIKTLAVYCGSKSGGHPRFERHAAKLGELIGKNNYNLIYGGGSSGLMGLVAGYAVENGAHVTGIVTEAFSKTSYYRRIRGVDEIVVPDLDVRKREMKDRSDGFIALPGGFGSLDEFTEMPAIIDMLMAVKSCEYVKPLIILDTNDHHKHLKKYFRDCVDNRFVHDGRQNVVRFVDKPSKVIGKFNQWNVEGIMRHCDIPPTPSEGSRYSIEHLLI